MYSSCPPPESGSLPRANLFMERAFDDATFTCFDETMRHLNLAKNKLAARPLRGRAKIILRLPALRVSGRVIFPDLGPMSDDDFIDLVRRAIQSGFRVYIKDLPFGQAAVPTLKDNRTVSLIERGTTNEIASHVNLFGAFSAVFRGIHKAAL